MDNFIKVTVIVVSSILLYSGCGSHTMNVIKETNDQTLLAKIATENEDRWIRQAAVEKITDQTLLKKFATEDKYENVRIAAVNNIIDQVVINNIVTHDADERVQVAAVKKLTDQRMLAKFAIENINLNIRCAAVKNLYDQEVLKKIATGKDYTFIRVVAVNNLTDQTLLKKFATEDKEPSVREAAVGRITDQEFLINLATNQTDHFLLSLIINLLKYPDPILSQKIGNIENVTRDAIECYARMTLAIQEPKIKLRFPYLQCALSVMKTNEEYHIHANIYNLNERVAYMNGEIVEIKLLQRDTIITGEAWSTVFPKIVQTTSESGFINAKVSGEDLMKRLLHKNIFTSGDLFELILSNIPEVRIGAIANLSDRELLTKVATKDKNLEVRIAAEDRIKELANKN
jgi:hypothetical protein